MGASRKLGKFRHLYRYKGTKTRANDKINFYLFLLCRVQSPYVKVEKKVILKRKISSFYDTWLRHYDTRAELATIRRKRLRYAPTVLRRRKRNAKATKTTTKIKRQPKQQGQQRGTAAEKGCLQQQNRREGLL